MTAAGIPGWHPAQKVLAEKAALDNGWEVPPVLDTNGGLRCSSSRVDDVVWIIPATTGPLLACSRRQLWKELSREWPESVYTLAGVGSVLLPSWDLLDQVLLRAAHLARSLPNNPAQEFRKRTCALPKSTEAERLVVQRVGQGLFREALIDYWGGRCAVTGLDILGLLRASHIKPWAACATDEERLDVYNGLLLAPHLDALFDGGWLTFDDDGRGRWSSSLPETALTSLGLHKLEALSKIRLQPEHLPYLRYHRNTLFK